MSCQKVLSMLSAYIDGEVQTSDAEMIESHLSQCDPCAAEYRALQGMTGMLRTTPEVEPPAFLLAQIEAATVNRTGLLTKVRSSFNQVPVMVRWATAPVAAAIVLLSVLLSNNNGNIQTPVAVKSPTERIQGAIPGMPSLPNVAPDEQAPATETVVAVRPVSTDATPRVQTVRTPAVRTKVVNHKSHSGQVKSSEVSEPKLYEESKVEASAAEQPEIAANVPDEPEPEVVTKTVGAVEPVAVTKTSDVKPARKTIALDEQPGGMDQLRKKLAAKNRVKFNGQEDRLEGKKYSVGLVSLRF